MCFQTYYEFAHMVHRCEHDSKYNNWCTHKKMVNAAICYFFDDYTSWYLIRSPLELSRTYYNFSCVVHIQLSRWVIIFCTDNSMEYNEINFLKSFHRTMLSFSILVLVHFPKIVVPNANITIYYTFFFTFLSQVTCL